MAVRRQTARRVRALVLTPAAVLLAAGVAHPLAAQPPAGAPPAGGPMGGPGGRGPGMRAVLFQGITLNAAQQAAVDSIQNASRERMRARMQQQGGGAPADDAARAARREAMMQEMQSDRAAMRAVLTADQRTAFDANVARMAARMRERMPQGGPGGPAARR